MPCCSLNNDLPHPMSLTTPSNVLNTFTTSSVIGRSAPVHHDLFETDDSLYRPSDGMVVPCVSRPTRCDSRMDRRDQLPSES